MLYHIFFFLLIFAGYFFCKSHYIGNASKNKFLLWTCVIMALQSGLRHVAVGADTYNYYLQYTEVRSIDWNYIWRAFYETYVLGEGKDPGYFVFQKLFSYLTSNFTIYLLSIATLFFYAWGKVVKRFTNGIEEALTSVGVYYLMFYSFFSITGLRQTTAVALSLLAFLALIDKKYGKFICLLIPAFFIHKSAAIILIYPLLYRFNNQKLLWRIMIVGFVVDLIFRRPIMSRFMEMAEYETDYYARPPYALMVLMFVMSIYIYYYIRRLPQQDRRRNLFNMYAISFAWIPLLGWDSMFMRQILYFSVYSTILIPLSYIGKDKIVGDFFRAFCFLYFLIISGDYAFFWQEKALGSNYF